ncbi:hypothetical protein HK405_014137, partial [Cladochytrium tenue]
GIAAVDDETWRHEDDHSEGDADHDEGDDTGGRPADAEARRRVGVACKQLLNAGRARFAARALNLRRAGAARYVDRVVSPENVVLLAAGAVAVDGGGNADKDEEKDEKLWPRLPARLL